MLELAEQLRAVGVYSFPCWAKHDPVKNKWRKGPSVPAGEPWQLSALRPVNDPHFNWASGVIGVPVPADLLVLDLDKYKGATREAIDAAVGCALPWDQAFIQTTIGGGEHYAFRCRWKARQGDSIAGVPGFDTRAALRGFICSGAGYAPVNHGGVFAFASPEVLPELPDACRRLLEVVDQPPTSKTEYQPRAQDAQILEALRHIDPGCSRDKWRNIGYALKALYAQDDIEGQAVFESWSSGELWDGDQPHNYVSDGKGSVSDQWPTFKAEGGVNPQTLFYWAIDGGWRPPPTVDAAEAFCAAPDRFDTLIDQIRRDGADVKKTENIIESIKAAGCSPLQTALLAAELKTELKGAGIKDKAIDAHVDRILNNRQADFTPAGFYGKNDTDNALTFLNKYYPEGALARCDGAFYRFEGRHWSRLTTDTLKHQIAADMAQQRMQESKVSACFRMTNNLTPVLDGQLNCTPENLVVFNNGVFDLNTGVLNPHDRRLFTTNILPYDWNPSATCPQWLEFLNDIFSNDYERVALLQEWLGYLLTGSNLHEKIMILLGGPGSGKGTIGKVLAALVGEHNFSGGSLSKLVVDSYLDGLSEKPVVFIGDAAKKVSPVKIHDVIETLKAISGNDALGWHRMYHGLVTRVLPTRFTIAANSVPSLFDDSGALASRMMLLTFDKSYRGTGKEDLTLVGRLINEIEGIAAWALEGVRRLNQNGRFTKPAACAEEHNLIVEDYCSVQRFVNACCTFDPAAETSGRELYDAYRSWALSEGEDPVRQRSLVNAIRDAYRGRSVRYGVHWEGGKSTRGFQGLAVRAVTPFQPRVITSTGK